MRAIKIIALATCHNRRKKTLSALNSLQAQLLPSGCSLEICLVDDGSIDGTGDAVRRAFPDIKVLEGTGKLYWAGGMRFGWEKYVKHQYLDYLLVFNDDVQLNRIAVSKLLSAGKIMNARGYEAHAVAGAFKDIETNTLSYSGLVLRSLWHPLLFDKLPPNESIQECNTLNMNLALLHFKALKLTGFLSPEFTHCKADFDFGLRLRKKGGVVVLAPGYVGTCNINPITGLSSEPAIPFWERYRRLTSIKEHPPKESVLYLRRHGGVLWPIFLALPYFWICAESLFFFIFRKDINKKFGPRA
ncbi:MAG: glycosyltransferase family 2 protein [Candidatus Electrothrix sp. AW1]|nr:glycosyltransferase family 2 protein [Candidatus Electrothrix sp. AX1]MCI5181667.1 glycosyltransferase family 2 protein [Candidatus Electrothrix gigas]